MNVPSLTIVVLALATLVHLKLQHDRENEPQTVYVKSKLLDESRINALPYPFRRVNHCI